MNYEKMVAPLIARSETTGEWHSGSGFLVCIDRKIYLATAAHLCDYTLAPRLEWPLWSKSVWLVESSGSEKIAGSIKQIEQYSLFVLGHRDKLVPKFKYVRVADQPENIVDLILLPVQTDSLIASTYDIFDLPSRFGPYEHGAEAIQLGRRDDFPALSVTTHQQSDRDGPVRHITPEGEKGDSGGPVVNISGCLLGMNIGSHEDYEGAAMLMSAELIVAASTAIRGTIQKWPDLEVPTPVVSP